MSAAVSVLPPSLPPGAVMPIPGVGELFVRRAEGPPDATPLLLLHGWQATADVNFWPLYESLAEHRTVLAFDLRGHGRSFLPEEPFSIEAAADDAAALLDFLGVEHAVVAGYSLGTAVAQTMVARHRSRVRALVLMAGLLASNHRPHEKIYNRVGGWLGTAQRMSSGRWGARRIVDKALRETDEAGSYADWFVREMERGHPGSLRAAGRALGRFDGRPIAAANPATPTAVVLTGRDRLVKPTRQADLASAWRARVVHLDADHDAPIAQPRRFLGAAGAAINAVAVAAEEHHASA